MPPTQFVLSDKGLITNWRAESRGNFKYNAGIKDTLQNRSRKGEASYCLREMSSKMQINGLPNE